MGEIKTTAIEDGKVMEANGAKVATAMTVIAGPGRATTTTNRF